VFLKNNHFLRILQGPQRQFGPDLVRCLMRSPSCWRFGGIRSVCHFQRKKDWRRKFRVCRKFKGERRELKWKWKWEVKKNCENCEYLQGVNFNAPTRIRESKGHHYFTSPRIEAPGNKFLENRTIYQINIPKIRHPPSMRLLETRSPRFEVRCHH
jgi:hypothetical protein